jgi:hypothetical protein
MNFLSTSSPIVSFLARSPSLLSNIIVGRRWRQELDRNRTHSHTHTHGKEERREGKHLKHTFMIYK